LDGDFKQRWGASIKQFIPLGSGVNESEPLTMFSLIKGIATEQGNQSRENFKIRKLMEWVRE